MQGMIIRLNDLIIASVVMANEGTLVINNVKEFSRVKELKLENWIG
jgi:tRNA(fMet)-specific endonuclease VapC